jgi:hypothetical protein
MLAAEGTQQQQRRKQLYPLGGLMYYVAFLTKISLDIKK